MMQKTNQQRMRMADDMRSMSAPAVRPSEHIYSTQRLVHGRSRACCGILWIMPGHALT